jgi:hypothetical protein
MTGVIDHKQVVWAVMRVYPAIYFCLKLNLGVLLFQLQLGDFVFEYVLKNTGEVIDLAYVVSIEVPWSAKERDR